MCLRDDVTDPEVIENWIFDLDYDRVLPLVVLDGDQIVANGTLQFNPIGWTKHQGEIRITCDPKYREKGLATILVENLMQIAVDFDLQQLTAEMATALDEAISAVSCCKSQPRWRRPWMRPTFCLKNWDSRRPRFSMVLSRISKEDIRTWS